MNRGSPIFLLRDRMRPACFNEAPIHESGKCRASVKASPLRNGFNEAPIHESGKFEGDVG